MNDLTCTPRFTVLQKKDKVKREKKNFINYSKTYDESIKCHLAYITYITTRVVDRDIFLSPRWC
jgi:hypothetical protein